MKVLWVSRHEPLESQLKELQRLFGADVQVDRHTKAYANAAEVVRVYRRGFYDEMVLIAPLSVCKVIATFGIKPLYSDMEQIEKGDPRIELTVNNTREKLEKVTRYYRFVKFKRMERIEIVFTELDS